MAEQSGGEFTPTFPTTRTRHATVPEHAKFAKVRRRSLLRLKPLQPRTQSLQPKPLQAEPHRRSHRMARSLRGRRGSVTVLAETGSHWSDSTLLTVGVLKGLDSARLARLEFTLGHRYKDNQGRRSSNVRIDLLRRRQSICLICRMDRQRWDNWPAKIHHLVLGRGQRSIGLCHFFSLYTTLHPRS